MGRPHQAIHRFRPPSLYRVKYNQSECCLEKSESQSEARKSTRELSVVETQQGYPKEKIKQKIKSVHIGYQYYSNGIKCIKRLRVSSSGHRKLKFEAIKFYSSLKHFILGSVSPMVQFFTGILRTDSVSPHMIVALSTFCICSLTALVSYTYGKYHLKKYHKIRDQIEPY